MKPLTKSKLSSPVIRPPRVPTLAFSLRNKTEAAYRDRLRVFKKVYGVAFSFATSARLTPQRKGAITRKARQLAEFVNPKNKFVFVPASPSLLKKAKRSKTSSTANFTARGVFVPTPKVARRKTNVRIDPKTGEISTRTGKSRSTRKVFRTADVVKNPEMIIAEAKKRGAERIFVSIKGHRGKKEKYGYTLKAFLEYMKRELLDDMEEQSREDYEEGGDEENRVGAFKNFFGVEFVTHEWTRPKTKKSVSKRSRK